MNLTELRKQIDSLDGQLVELFNKRMECARQIAEVKETEGSPVFSPMRERDVLVRASDMADERIQKYCKILFSTLIDVSKAYQREFISAGKIAQFVQEAIKATPAEWPFKCPVAVQGIDGAYSGIAAEKLFEIPSLTYFRDFDGVFNAVEKGLCKYGVLPIENSSAGSVVAVYEAMQKHKFHIARSLKLRINHCLLGNANANAEAIREIVSHEQALNQCSRFVAKLGDVKITVSENTATAAEYVRKSGRNDIFALSSSACAELYGLKAFKTDVQNTDNNYTRFICIAKNLEVYEGSNRISIMVSLPHAKGSLYRLISKFAALDINLLKIESRPLAGSDFEFMFYFDFEASLKDEKTVRLLSELEGSLSRFVLLGNYTETI